jgi:oxygen-independent coproporphyrinogen III oxidase
MTSHHLYVHVPFCRLVCAYCDFVTVAGRRADIPAYVEALIAELAMRPAPGLLDTVYFGGGTPSLLPASAVARVVETAKDRWLATPTEVTLEANPSAREAPEWSALRSAGVNRISLGAQSLRDADLRRLARGHTASEVREAYAACRAAGFDNVSLDLIYGIPDQSVEDWRRGLQTAIELQPDHLSLYALQLALEPDEWAAPTRRGALRWRRRLAARQDDDLSGDQYRVAEDVLGKAGYCHYELSSWALPGRESRHNLAYWARKPYTGIGAGAHSYDGAAERSWNTASLDTYLDDITAGRRPVAGRDLLDEAALVFEAIALGLRRIDGVSRSAFAKEFGVDPAAHYRAAVSRGVDAGLLALSDDAMRLTRTGRLLANEVLVEFVPNSPSTPPLHPPTRVDMGLEASVP